MTSPATSRLLRRMNAQRVLDTVRAADGPLRVTELVALTELSRPTVDAVASVTTIASAAQWRQGRGQRFMPAPRSSRRGARRATTR